MQPARLSYVAVPWRTGARVNELLTITPRDIEPHNDWINVTKAKGGVALATVKSLQASAA
jgi:integrase